MIDDDEFEFDSISSNNKSVRFDNSVEVLHDNGTKTISKINDSVQTNSGNAMDDYKSKTIKLFKCINLKKKNFISAMYKLKGLDVVLTRIDPNINLYV